jgi:S1-C subfamily serine protease
MGADFEALTASECRDFDIEGGVMVTNVHRGGIFDDQTSVREGFIITSIDDEDMSSTNELSDALKDKTEGVLIEGFYPRYPSKIYNYHFNLK